VGHKFIFISFFLLFAARAFAVETTIKGGRMELVNKGESVVFSEGVQLDRGGDQLKAKKMKMDVEPKQTNIMAQVESRSKSKDKYRERRDKNNAASKRSREIKKQKYIEMDKEADTLEIKNEALRKKIVELEELAKFMKAELIRKMTSK
jgi:lipopolysaccharide export system protein LptA